MFNDFFRPIFTCKSSCLKHPSNRVLLVGSLVARPMGWGLMAEFGCFAIALVGVLMVCLTIAPRPELAAVVSEFAAMNC